MCYTAIQGQPTPNRVLVISGGGCRGAWGAGLAKRLTKEHGVYNVAFGTSTGSLMIPLILQSKFDDLERGYTTVTAKDIFDVNPFREDGEFRWFNALKRILFKKPTLGETNALRRLIDSFVKDDDYVQLRAQKKFFGVGVVNMKTGEKATKYSATIEGFQGIDAAREMKDWIWASCNQPFLMTYYPSKNFPNPKETGLYVDGGLRETVPLSDALLYARYDSSVRNIDVIVNEPMIPWFDERNHPTTLLKSLKRATDIWRAEVIDNDVLLATMDVNCDSSDQIGIQIHYFPTGLYPKNANDLLFNQENMREMWQMGFDGVEDQGPNQTTFFVCRERIKEYFRQLKQYNQSFRALYTK